MNASTVTVTFVVMADTIADAIRHVTRILPDPGMQPQPNYPIDSWSITEAATSHPDPEWREATEYEAMAWEAGWRIPDDFEIRETEHGLEVRQVTR